MVKVIVFLTKRADITAEDFSRYWRETHGPLGAAMPGLRRYVQNRPVVPGAPYDGVAEMWFDDMESVQKAFSSPEAAAAAADVPNLLSGTQMMIVDETPIVEGS